MSSRQKWAKKEIDIAKDSVSHDATSVTKKSSVKIGRTDGNITIKIGLRIKKSQTVDLFQIKVAGSPSSIDLTRIDDTTDWRYADINLVLPPGNDDQWILYTTSWAANYGKSFDTTIRLKPHYLHDNGFQVVTVVATANDVPLATGHYIFGVSIIPGASNEGEPYFVGGAARKGKGAKGKQGSKGKKVSTKKKRK